MPNNFESDIKYAPYKEVVKKKALEYYYTYKEVISEKNKSKYKSLSPEQKTKRQESTKWWLDKQSPERKEELRQKARDYQKKQVSKPYGRTQRVVGNRGLYSRTKSHLFLCKIMCHYLLK